LSEDPIGYQAEDANPYRYVVNKPTVGVDPTGNVLYAVDGTTNTQQSNTNVWQFFQRTQGLKHYWNGPGGVLNGAGSPEIVRGVERQIQIDYRHFVNGQCNVVIDLVGYSRGAVIAATVARDLDRPGLVLGGRWINHIPVRWIGLFDAVSQMGPLMTVPGGWATTFSSNIGSYAHAIHTADQGRLFPIETRFAPATPFNWPDGRRTTHEDLGHEVGPLNWMIQQAQTAGVPVR
jgi:hypothetical protein